MTAAAPSFSPAVSVGSARPRNSTGIKGMSPGKFSPKRKAMTYRQHFAASWSSFIRECFDSPEHAAMVFGVDASTSRKWWEGSHAPSGFAVGYAFAMNPDAAAHHLAGDA